MLTMHSGMTGTRCVTASQYASAALRVLLALLVCGTFAILRGVGTLLVVIQ
jgi:hypothetical protein